MLNVAIAPDDYVITSVIRACGRCLGLEEGRQVHCQALKLGSSSNRTTRIRLLEFYGKCGEFEDANRILDEMPQRDVVAMTIMMDCYFDRGLLQEANGIFSSIKKKDTVCWTVMIFGLVRNGEMNRALETFREMQRQDTKPNEFTIVSVLSACSQLGALQLGRWVHSYVGRHDIVLNHYVGGALISMYSRCGDIDEAQRVFSEMKERNVITYNSMIVGLALHGKSIEAVELFLRMLKQGFKPTGVTFIGVLNACSHGGLVDLGYKIFRSMDRDYGIEPQIEHCSCMVDLLGRVGKLKEAFDLISRMKVAPDHIMLSSLLNACKINGNLNLATQVAENLMACGDADSGNYVLLASAYSSLGKWEEAAQVRAKMKEYGIEKEPGCSSIEVNNEIHEFLLGDMRHPQKEQIYLKLKEMNKVLTSEGYSPATQIVLHDIEDWEKEWALSIHSEKLAICYGLVASKPFTTIRVVNNLKVCNDCHTMIKLVSKITSRKIVLRDRKRFHHFENGSCSCGDSW
ncbi:hypothetical protein K2173_018399 [Erythroxylum novogranatense]|uniref:DYW domain-containing protein n=1 Tax=Erythroxylum novogranatense TaxID=1862640 RepID=A0AAV8UA61_9ROSI|nr:hypothetical protein K2173_018399 [Erythroxylum novogranatense]